MPAASGEPLRTGRHPALAGWLYTCVRKVAANLRRSTERRRRREQVVRTMNEPLSSESSDSTWDQVRPLIDEAMHQLGETDRAAVVLRFFEGRSLKEVGLALDLNENAARMRVDRALEKLRLLLAQRGITSTASGLASALAAAVLSVPADLAAHVAAGALTAGGATTSAAFTVLKLMSMIKFKAAIASALVVAGLATPAVLQHQSLSKLRGENVVLLEQTRLLDKLREENNRLRSLQVAADELERLRKEHGELLTLRGQVGVLRRELAETARFRAENNRSQAAATNIAVNDGSSITNPPNFGMDPVMRRRYGLPTKLAEARDVGAATPEALLESWMWALRTGNTNRVQELWDWPPEAPESVKQGFFQALASVKASGGYVAGPQDLMGCQIVSKTPVGDTDVVLNILNFVNNGVTNNSKFRLRRLGNEWRIVVGKDGQPASE